jgi:geranylgeranyl reductase family protein
MRDVIIIGAGPAGSSLAYYLAKEGIEVLLIDKARFPRYKPCAGAFSVSLDNLLDFSLKEVIESTHSSMIFKKNDKEFKLLFDFPVIYLVNRKHFDYLLLKKALETGASLTEGVNAIEIKKNSVITDAGEFCGNIIVGADGGGSLVRRQGNYKRIKTWLKTISADIPSDKYNEIIFDFSWTKRGYAWIFPKKNTLSIGLGDHPKNLKQEERVLSKFLNYYNLPYPEKTYKYTYPLFSSPEPLSWRNTILIGDAAALSNPVSGGGIYNGIESAYIASRVIKLNLSKGIPLKYYQRLLKRHFFPLLTISGAFNILFIKKPIEILKAGKFFFYWLTKHFSSYKPPF